LFPTTSGEQHTFDVVVSAIGLFTQPVLPDLTEEEPFTGTLMHTARWDHSVDLADARVASVKGALGHWIAGAGALGALCGIEAVARGVLLPTAGLCEPDARCALPHVIGAAERRPVAAALVNAFAFGGANASLVVRRC